MAKNNTDKELEQALQEAEDKELALQKAQDKEMEEALQKVQDEGLARFLKFMWKDLKEGQRRLEKDVGSLKEDVGSLKEDVGSLKNDMGRLKAAIPGAADIPNVFLVGDTYRAKVEGASSTWTLVKAKTAEVHSAKVPSSISGAGYKKDEPFTPVSTQSILPRPVTLDPAKKESGEEFTYFLVSSAHCVGEVATCTVKKEVINMPASLIYLCNGLKDVLVEDGDEQAQDNSKVRVKNVGFHRMAIEDTVEFQKNPQVDILFLELEEAPIAAKNCGVPIITPIAVSDVDELNMCSSVSGTSLSGRVNGTSVQNLRNKNGCTSGIISFIPSFAEGDRSGTVMFGLRADGKTPTALGCFKGFMANKKETIEKRGCIVTFPDWNDVKWCPVKRQLEQINKGIQITNNTTLEVEDNQNKNHKQRGCVLTFEKQKDYVFGVGGNGSSAWGWQRR